MDNSKPEANISGDQLRELVEAGAKCLETNSDAIDALNVFPVPDGDTGINMLLTVQAAISAPELPPPGSQVGEVSQALARGALLGARGNSGVIFSQFMKGLASGLSGHGECDGRALGQALASAADAAYKAVGNPVEGTMLTVMRGAAEGAQGADGQPATVLRSALKAAERALANTPEQLPVLKEAGVVDAGGQGVVAFLTGAVAHLEGEDPAVQILEPADGAAPPATVSQEFLEHSEDEMYGYCTQFIILGDGLDLDRVRDEVMAIAGSTVVIGDERVVRVHAHATDPGPLLSLGVGKGALDQIKIENMDTQHQGFMQLHGYQRQRVPLAVIAVAPGKGLERVFIDLGAMPVPGGQTMNPSAQDLVDAIKRANAEASILLPNNKNIIMAAKQAAELADGPVIVVPSRSVPQGVAALLRYSPDLSASENAQSMEEALDEVLSGEVTTAVRSTTVEGTPVKEGEVMALLNDSLVATAPTPQEALVKLVEKANPAPGSLVTVYFGSSVNAQEAVKVADLLKERFDGLETDVIEGGQPHYHYIISID